MLKLGKLTDYATVLMVAIAAEPLRIHAALDLAQRTHIAPPTVSKLLKLLTKAGLLASVRGAHGGYRLPRLPEQLRVADVVRAIEGPIALTECASHGSTCALQADCGLRAPFQLINAAIEQALEALSLADLARRLPPQASAAATEFPITFSAPKPHVAGAGDQP